MVIYNEYQRPKSRSFKLGVFLLIVQLSFLFFFQFKQVINEGLSLMALYLLPTSVLWMFLLCLFLFEARLFIFEDTLKIQFWPFKSFILKREQINYFEMASVKKLNDNSIKCYFFNSHKKIYYSKGVILHFVTGEKFFIGTNNPIVVCEILKHSFGLNEI
jgi:hypothetical protein